MKSNKLLLGLVGFGATVAMVKYREFIDFKNRSEIYFQSLNIVPGSFEAENYTSVKFLLKLKIKNPTNFSIELDKIQVFIYCNNYLIGEIYSTEKTVIAKKAFNTFNETISLDLKKLPANVFGAVTEAIESGKLKLSYVGMIKSFWGKIHFNKIQNFSFK